MTSGPRWGSRGLAAFALALILGGMSTLPSPAQAYVEAPVPDGGTVLGQVRFAGTPPKGEPVPVRRNLEQCGTSKPFEALVVGPAMGVRNTVVYLEGIERGKKAPDVVLDNAKCVFTPHVVPVTLGAGKVLIKNSDPLLHNTHGVVERLTAFNIALPSQGQVVDITRRIKKVGAIEVLCDAHTHMQAWIVVRDSPYFAVTDEQGQFRIDEVPPGRYRLVAWHEGWVATGRDKDGRPVYDAPRVLTQEVTVPPSGEVAVTFELK